MGGLRGWWKVISRGVGVLVVASDGDPLDLALRRRLFEQVQRFPGLHLREVARELDINPNHAKYHLQRLEKHGLISSRHEDGYWRFWPREEGAVGYRDRLSRQDKSILAVLRRPVPLHVTLLLLDREEATHGELLEDVDVVHSTLHYHLTKMVDNGILVSRKESRERWFRLKDPHRILQLLLEYRPPKNLIHRFLDAWEQVEADPRAIRGGGQADRPSSAGQAKVRILARHAESDGSTDPPPKEEK